LTENDIKVLARLVNVNNKTTDDLSKELQVSKSAITLSLNRLMSLGLVQRTKEKGDNIGRPRYVYYITNFDTLKDKLVKEIEDCTNGIRNLVQNLSPSFLAP
jgi:predicted transcriptional regulator